MSDDNIYADASQASSLHYGVKSIDCLTLQEAVLEWMRLSEQDRAQATIRVSDGTALRDTDGDPAKVGALFSVLSRDYPDVMTICPETSFVEFDFLEKQSFLVEKDAELVKQSAWMTSHCHALKNAIMERNRNIVLAGNRQYSWHPDFDQIGGVIGILASISSAECTYAKQAFDAFESIAQKLYVISDSYRLPNKKRIIPPATLDEAIKRLTEITAPIIAKMTA